jgi:hypothetical protein
MPDQPTQRSHDEMRAMSLDQLRTAFAAGELSDVLSARPSGSDPGKSQLSVNDLQRLTPDEIDEAHRAGRLNEVLRAKA